jgi:ribosomal protein S18 acetylase RimI-like enzyme
VGRPIRCSLPPGGLLPVGPGRVSGVDASQVVVEPVTPDHWPDVETVFGERGDPARCWCQWFFAGASARAEDAAANREALRAQVEAGPPPGVLARIGGEPVGWAAVAPRPGYSRLTRSPVLRGTPAAEFADASVWAVTCFVVRVGFRRRGIAAALLDGAVAHARAGGARLVEAYPVDVAAKAAVSSAELYHGPLSVFLAAGFREVRRSQPGRPVVRLEPPGS